MYLIILDVTIKLYRLKIHAVTFCNIKTWKKYNFFLFIFVLPLFLSFFLLLFFFFFSFLKQTFSSSSLFFSFRNFNPHIIHMWETFKSIYMTFYNWNNCVTYDASIIVIEYNSREREREMKKEWKKEKIEDEKKDLIFNFYLVFILVIRSCNTHV